MQMQDNGKHLNFKKCVQQTENSSEQNPTRRSYS